MTEDLLQDLALYKKSHEKAVSVAARSLIMLFREVSKLAPGSEVSLSVYLICNDMSLLDLCSQVCPSLLVKKDRGRPTDAKAKLKAYGEVHVASNVPGAELLNDADEDHEDNNDAEDNCSEDDACDSDGESLAGTDDDLGNEEACLSDDKDDGILSDDDGGEELEEYGSMSDDEDIDDRTDDDNDDEEDEDDDGDDQEPADEEVTEFHESDENIVSEKGVGLESKGKKRKSTSFDGQLIAGDASLRALKRLAAEKMEKSHSEVPDGILSNEQFQRIKELQVTQISLLL